MFTVSAFQRTSIAQAEGHVRAISKKSKNSKNFGQGKNFQYLFKKTAFFLLRNPRVSQRNPRISQEVQEVSMVFVVVSSHTTLANLQKRLGAEPRVSHMSYTPPSNALSELHRTLREKIITTCGCMPVGMYRLIEMSEYLR